MTTTDRQDRGGRERDQRARSPAAPPTRSRGRHCTSGTICSSCAGLSPAGCSSACFPDHAVLIARGSEERARPMPRFRTSRRSTSPRAVDFLRHGLQEWPSCAQPGIRTVTRRVGRTAQRRGVAALASGFGEASDARPAGERGRQGRVERVHAAARGLEAAVLELFSGDGPLERLAVRSAGHDPPRRPEEHRGDRAAEEADENGRRDLARLLPRDPPVNTHESQPDGGGERAALFHGATFSQKPGQGEERRRSRAKGARRPAAGRGGARPRRGAWSGSSHRLDASHEVPRRAAGGLGRRKDLARPRRRPRRGARVRGEPRGLREGARIAPVRPRRPARRDERRRELSARGFLPVLGSRLEKGRDGRGLAIRRRRNRGHSRRRDEARRRRGESLPDGQAAATVWA